MWQSTRRGRTPASTAVRALFLSLSRIFLSAPSDEALAVARRRSLAVTMVLKWVRLLKNPAAGFRPEPRRWRSSIGWGGWKPYYKQIEISRSCNPYKRVLPSIEKDALDPGDWRDPPGPGWTGGTWKRPRSQHCAFVTVSTSVDTCIRFLPLFPIASMVRRGCREDFCSTWVVAIRSAGARLPAIVPACSLSVLPRSVRRVGRVASHTVCRLFACLLPSAPLTGLDQDLARRCSLSATDGSFRSCFLNPSGAMRAPDIELPPPPTCACPPTPLAGVGPSRACGKGGQASGLLGGGPDAL